MRKQGILYGMLLAICGFLLAACTADPSATGATLAPAHWLVQVGYGETISIDQDNLSITFDELLEDSRCPSDVMCAWSGWVRVALTLAQPQKEPSSAMITAFSDSKGVVETTANNKDAIPVAEYAPYRITLRKVLPYPATTKQQAPASEYRITVEVERLGKKNTKPQGPPPPTSVPAPTPAADETATPVVGPPVPPELKCPDAMALPVLCISYKAFAEKAAGASVDAPAQLTDRVAICALPNRLAGNAVCTRAFGDTWEMAEMDVPDKDSIWYDLVPVGQPFWLWDRDKSDLYAFGLEHPAQPSNSITVSTGRPFSVKTGDSAMVSDGSMTVTFNGVTKDERCPTNAACEVRGAVSLVLEMTPRDMSPLAPEFTVATDELGTTLDDSVPVVEYGGYTVYILAVTPYPEDANTPIDPTAYTVKVILSR